MRASLVEQGDQVPAIALTAKAKESDREQALAAGYQQHLAKPVDPDGLLRTVLAIVPSRI